MDNRIKFSRRSFIYNMIAVGVSLVTPPVFIKKAVAKINAFIDDEENRLIRDLSLSFSVKIKKYRSNYIYINMAEQSFIKNTTSTDVGQSLAVQSFFDKIFSINAIKEFVETTLKEEIKKAISISSGDINNIFQIENCKINNRTSINKIDTSHYTLKSSFQVKKGWLNNISYNLCFVLPDWNKENFICAPGACYNSGRFERHKMVYPPFLPESKWEKDIPIITALIPGLDNFDAKSKMDLLMNEITSKMLGIWLKDKSKCIWINLKNIPEGSNGLSINEDLIDKRLAIDITTPMVREPLRFHGSSTLPSWDKGICARKGDERIIELDIYSFDCRNFHEFYASFKKIQIDEKARPSLSNNEFPLSESWKLIENQYNEKKWSEEFGYYHAGFLPPFVPAQSWSAGWTGGLALSYALLNNGNDISRTRALRNLEFFFSEAGQSQAGIFYATSDGIEWGGDNYFVTEHIGSKDWIHVRRCGDYLYFVIKHFKLLEERGESDKINIEWLEKMLKCADALCEIWETNNHFGQYINPNTLEIIIGNSDAGSIIPAALAVCSLYFDEPKYIDTAEKALTLYYNDFVSKGFTAGGPLDILCAPDCESAINMLESLVVLYETTKDNKWIEMAHIFSDYVLTWFYTYDVKFPPESTYSELGVRTTGSILASSQNRCAVPNICTLSGDVFWRLCRYTKDFHLMYIIQECVHNTQQYISRLDKPIKTLRGKMLSEGTIHECIQTGDWTGPTGEIPYEYPTSWTEVAHLLSICELPGIYVIKDMGKVFVLDHLDVILNFNELEIINNTHYDCNTTIFIENEIQMEQILPFNAISNSIKLHIPANETIKLSI